MEGKSHNASGSSPAPKTAGNSGQATVTIKVYSFNILVQSMNPNIDADLLMAKMGLVPTPPPAVDAVADEGLEKGSGGPIAEREAEPEVTEKSMETGVENPTERVNEATDGMAGERKVPTAAIEEGEIKRTTPRDEAARARAATMHIYQRRPGRAEALRKKTTEEKQKGAPEKKTDGGDERQERSSVGPLRRRRRLVLDDEPDEIEEEVAFTLIEALPSSGQPTPPAETKDPEREKGKEKERESHCWSDKEEAATGFINTRDPRGTTEGWGR